MPRRISLHWSAILDGERAGLIDVFDFLFRINFLICSFFQDFAFSFDFSGGERFF